MNPAEFDRKSITIESDNKKILFKANGSTIKFEGYLKVYKFEEKDEDLKNILPEVKVGDKVSIILAPALAACGLKVPMISGRGLGHTGGTLDKLESIAGFRVDLSINELQKQVGEIGFAMVGQTDSLAPADRRMYALRDVTGTVVSIPLITSSIVSKKAAEGISALVLDVKYGRAAFMIEREQAEALSQSMADAANGMGIATSVILSTMDQPLGCAVGNALEIVESVETLCGRGPHDLEELAKWWAIVPKWWATIPKWWDIDPKWWAILLKWWAIAPKRWTTTPK